MSSYSYIKNIYYFSAYYLGFFLVMIALSLPDGGNSI